MSDAVLDQSARVTVIPAPVTAPGHCAICGKTDHPKGFARTDNFDFEEFGSVIFCADCVGDYARVFGFISVEEYKSLMERLTVQSEELILLRESVVNLENILDAYAKLRNNTDPIGSSGSDDSSPPEDSNDVRSEAIEGAVSDGEAGERETSEPASVERRDDVRNTSSTDDLLAELGIT